ncbi:putative serine/threonine-protein kinase [Phytophthora ramorum]|uniref:putative serine/threonine-protein kinase n=1 Tax=Phytophthora ramorum TaxID=164328 RepID=UPI0030B14CD5|nr:putative serine/threonine-protein kinase [Phytophthora ramorum]
MHAASSPMEPLNKNILLAGEVIAEKWKIGEKIGEGTFSQIYSAYSIESRDKVAVKVEAPSSLKPVLEWESLILKSLQDCPYVCRYYYHGKHGDSTVLVMELLGESMSMLRMSPDSIHGVPLAKSVSVGLEMLDCIEAFHRHGYVHRDIKASNFALSAIPDRNPTKQQRYYIIDFGLSRQHLGEDRKVLTARQVAEFRGTSMYASLSSHRRQELGPKDDLWSWFYLVMDFMRGELPWAADAQLKNRQTVLRLKEHYTETNPSLLVEGLAGAAELLEMMDYLQSLKYGDFPDYGKVRKQLQAVGESSLVSENSDDEEANADKKEALAVAAVSAIDWSTIEPERERALQWADKADEQKSSDGASDMLLTIAKRYKTFFDSEGLSFDEQMKVQSAVYRIEKKSRVRSSFLAPPPIQSFVKRRQSEQKLRSDALRKRRERDFQVRQSLEIKNEQQLALATSVQGSSEAAHGIVNGNGTSEVQNGAKGSVLQPVKSESSMEVSDSEDVEAKRSEQTTDTAGAAAASQAHGSSVPMPHHQLPTMTAPTPPGPPSQLWDRSLNHGALIRPPPPPLGMLPSRYRRRSSDLGHSKSSHRHSSHSTSRHRSHSKDYPKEHPKGYSKEYSKGYPKDFPKKYAKDYPPKEYVKEYVKDYPPKEYAKDYPPKEYVKDYPPKEYVTDYPPKKYVKDYPPKGYAKDYPPKEYAKDFSPKEHAKAYPPKEYVKGYPKEYAKEYLHEYEKEHPYPSKDYRKDYPKEHPKEYKRRSPSPERRHSRSREPHRSPSLDRHRSHSRDYGRNDGSWGADARFQAVPTPEKHRRSSRWQQRS